VIAAAALVTPSAAAAARPAHQRPAKVAVTGQVQHRRSYPVAELRAFPQHTVTVRFASSNGTEHHTFTG
jgi:DMSO/TMAO reductase YedYZ molybdopterin-dependent catalytic subunit